jgi:hypothetical protein
VSSKGAYVGENQMAQKNGRNWLKKTTYFKLAKMCIFWMFMQSGVHTSHQINFNGEVHYSRSGCFTTRWK